VSTNNKSDRRDRHGFRGVPPPPLFSLADLADDAMVTKAEAAGWLRVAKSTVDGWREQPNHPLKWLELPGGFVRTTAGNIRKYIAAGAPRRRKDAAPARMNVNHNPENSAA
jgi:hypothetical protein